MRFLAVALLFAAALLVTFDVEAAESHIDRSAAWFKPAPIARSASHSRTRLGGSRLLPRRMYRSLPQNDYQGVWEKVLEPAYLQSDIDN